MTAETPDPIKAAAHLWQQLITYQPAIAAALAIEVRGLPDDWSAREFGSARPEAVLAYTPCLEPVEARFPPEVAPVTEASAEDCQACLADGVDLCRFHTGEAEAHDWWQRTTREAVRVEPEVTLREFLLRQSDAAEAEDRGEFTAAVDRLIGGA